MVDMFPIKYEIVIKYLNGDDVVKHYNKEYDEMDDCLREIRKFKVNENSEILEYNIRCQRVLI